MSVSERYARVRARVLPGTRTLESELVNGLPHKPLAESQKIQLGQFVAIGLQLALVVLVAQQFQIENQAFYSKILPLAVGGFAVHHFLPLRLRLPFFVLVSVAGLELVLGARNAFWLVALGLVLIGLCHVPVPFKFRLVLLGLVGVGLVVLRAGWTSRVGVPWSPAVWPLLGAMFMFRLIVYLYEVAHARGPLGVWRSLAYFFLLPNVVFPLFPVIDFATFRRTYYDTPDRYRIYQRGVNWLLIGMVILLAYRLVYQQLVLGPDEVATVGDLGRYAVANYLLYLQVIGQFFVIIGMLHLFGFNLPQPIRLLFWSSSFTDFWRKGNVYWKDFMLKVVYYPIYLRLTRRKAGLTTAMLVATLVVFVATWALHSWQWFWLRGAFLVSAPDMTFWGIFAVATAADSWLGTRRKQARSLGKRVWRTSELLGVALKTVAMFAAISVLWSLWSSPSIADWLALWSVIGVVTPESVGWLVALLVGAIGLGASAIYLARRSGEVPADSHGPRSFARQAALSGATLGALYLVGSPIATSRMGSDAQVVISDLSTTGLNQQDLDMVHRGYYQDLIDVGGFNSQLAQLYDERPARPADWVEIGQTPLAKPRSDFYGYELQPLGEIMFKGAVLRTNQWGMRDRDYELQKPPGTYRFALLGSSYVMGSGVTDDETFEKLVEDRLNREAGGGASAAPNYEILNFAVGGYSMLHQLMVVNEKALRFEPDAFLLVAHRGDGLLVSHHLAYAAQQGLDIPYDYLREVVQKAGVGRGTSDAEALRRMRPFENDVLSWIDRQIASEAQAQGIRPIWIYLTVPGDVAPANQIARLEQMAQVAGFTTVNLANVYAGYDPRTLQLASWDDHPNALAHRIIADRLYQALRQRGLA